MNEYRQQIIDEFIEVEPLNSDQFLRLKETLTRIGVPVKGEAGEKPTLWQSVHVFHNRGRYFLVHFKQMFLLDGRVKSTNITDTDLERLDSIAVLMERWGLVKLITKVDGPGRMVRVIPFQEKDKWNLQAKYNVGSKKRTNNE